MNKTKNVNILFTISTLNLNIKTEQIKKIVLKHFIFDMFWVILFGCYFVKIYMLYFGCEIDGAFSFKQNII